VDRLQIISEMSGRSVTVEIRRLHQLGSPEFPGWCCESNGEVTTVGEACDSWGTRPEQLVFARGIVHVNTVKSSHALIRRGLIGIYHNVSREYLHRYLWQFDFFLEQSPVE
jgi:hypothetical protein